MSALRTLKEWYRDVDDLIASQNPAEIKSTINMWQRRIDNAREKGASEEDLARYVAKVAEMHKALG